MLLINLISLINKFNNNKVNNDRSTSALKHDKKHDKKDM